MCDVRLVGSAPLFLTAPAATMGRPLPASTSTSTLCVAAAALLLALAAPVLAADVVTENSDCSQVPAQTALNYSKMRGTWYVVQIAEHLPAQSPPRAPVTKAACPQVDLWPPSQNKPDTRLSLHWREAGHGVHYDLRVPDPSHSGFWQADRPQNGSLAADGKYRQFEGAVMVLKVTYSHAVLTFCELPRQGRLVYSVVLSREPQLPAADLASLEMMLEHRGLPLAGTQRTCRNYRNGAPALPVPLAPAVMLLGFALAMAAVGARPL